MSLAGICTQHRFDEQVNGRLMSAFGVVLEELRKNVSDLAINNAAWRAKAKVGSCSQKLMRGGQPAVVERPLNEALVSANNECHADGIGRTVMAMTVDSIPIRKPALSAGCTRQHQRNNGQNPKHLSLSQIAKGLRFSPLGQEAAQ